MRIKIQESGDRLEISLYFPDSRLVDLEMALRRTGNDNRWQLSEEDKRLDHVEYEIALGGDFQAAVQFTHGLEPPTRAVFENKPSGAVDYSPAHKQSVVRVVKAFWDECAGRALLSDTQKEKAVAELNRHDKVEV